MNQEVVLSDLLLMQMVTGLEDFVGLATRGEDVQPYITSVKEQATTPDLFEEIISKTITTQLADKLTALRELGQNASI